MSKVAASVVFLLLLGSVALASDAIVDSLDILDAAVDALQQEWIFRYVADWDRFVSEILGTEMPDTPPHPTGTVASMATWQLGVEYCDWHAYTVTSEQVSASLAAGAEFVEDYEAGRPTSDGHVPCGGLVDGNVAYVWISATSSATMTWSGFAYPSAKGAQIARLVEDLDSTSLRGWIIDLRQHSGGSYEAGLIGLQAFLPEGRLFGFALPKEDGSFAISEWVERRGARFTLASEERGVGDAAVAGSSDSEWTVSVVAETPLLPHVLRSASVPVAVLTSSSTASAAEMLLIALRQNPGVRVFGEPTSGVNTDVAGCSLPDGSVLAFSRAYLAGPDGHIYRGSGASSATSTGGPAVLCLPGEPIAPDVARAVPHMNGAWEIEHEADTLCRLGPDAYHTARYDPAYVAALAWIREAMPNQP